MVKKKLMSIIIGLTSIAMVGCGNDSTQVKETKSAKEVVDSVNNSLKTILNEKEYEKAVKSLESLTITENMEITVSANGQEMALKQNREEKYSTKDDGVEFTIVNTEDALGDKEIESFYGRFEDKEYILTSSDEEISAEDYTKIIEDINNVLSDSALAEILKSPEINDKYRCTKKNDNYVLFYTGAYADCGYTDGNSMLSVLGIDDTTGLDAEITYTVDEAINLITNVDVRITGKANTKDGEIKCSIIGSLNMKDVGKTEVSKINMNGNNEISNEDSTVEVEEDNTVTVVTDDTDSNDTDNTVVTDANTIEYADKKFAIGTDYSVKDMEDMLGIELAYDNLSEVFSYNSEITVATKDGVNDKNTKVTRYCFRKNASLCGVELGTDRNTADLLLDKTLSDKQELTRLDNTYKLDTNGSYICVNYLNDKFDNFTIYCK